MYQVMIVEDELWMRRGLEQILEWKQFNINSVKSAKNGKEALELMENYKPDIIITDIKMPLIDGLSMVDRIAEKNEKMPKIIIISGYNDFDFAKKAIRHGVVDYILKPVDADELKEVIIKTTNYIDQEKKYSHITLNIELKNLIYEKMFSYSNYVPNYDVIQKDFYFSLIVKTTSTDAPIENLTDNDLTFVSLSVGLYQFNLIGSLNKGKLRYCMEEVYKKNNQTIGISSIKSDIERNFLSAYREAEIDFRIKYYHENESLKFQDVNIILSRIDEEKISKSLQSRNEKDVKKIIGSVLEKYCNLESKILIKFQIFIFLTRYLNNTQLSLYNVTEIFYKHRFVQTIEDIEEMYDQFFEPLIEEIINNFQSTKVNYVSFVKEYINANYYDSSLSLERVAESLNLSPAYLSATIKKDTNLNFITHVKNKRIESAKELLVKTNLPVYEISLKVGYNDVKYFIKVFKKETGHTPNRYRAVFCGEPMRWE
ncbi:MAG TPA: response regulator [Ureibacillus sp.]|nr:response regulator [Ureibacillus sp.]